MLIKGKVIIIQRDNLCDMITHRELLLEIDHNYNDKELYNFETMAVLEKDKAPFEFDPYSNLNVNVVLRNWITS